MGFYGNITNTSRTQFQFDKIYPNRKAMESAMSADKIYLGRHVLIEYDQFHLDDMIRVQVELKAGSKDEYVAYYNPQGQTGYNTQLKTNNVINNEIVYTSTSSNTPTTGLTQADCQFYQCINGDLNNSNPAIFKKASTNISNYAKNYHIDENTYGTGRGYDSTVWQKVFANNSEKYVMIAELNTVVPTFDVVAEAPTMNPVVPHFDTESTNVYYKLHWQAPWGFRVAAANASKSDTTTQWTTTTYNPTTGRNETSDPVTKHAAIYFNKDAFEPQVNSNSIKKKDTATNNEIKVMPVSSQQEIYDDHNPTTKTPVAANDIQELTINLPAIGNMMSDAWDIIHGPNRDNARTDTDGSLQGRLDSFKDMTADEIPVKRGPDGTIVGAKINGGKTSDDDLTGINDDAWIETMVNGNIEAITIKHTFTAVDDTTTTANKNNATSGNGDNKGKGDTLKLYTPKVDAKGHVVGKNIETVTLPFGYKTFKDSEQGTSRGESSANSTQDIFVFKGDNWIKPVVTNDLLTLTHQNAVAVDATKVDDVTNLTFGSTFTITDLYFDQKGHKSSTNTHTVKIPQGSLEIKDMDATTANVLTDIAFNSSTGKITVKQDNIGDLLLTGFTKVNNNDAWVQATDDIKGAFKKVDTRLDNEIERAVNAETALDQRIDNLKCTDTSTTQFISSISQEKGKIAVSRADAGTLVLGTASSSGIISATDSLNSAFNAIEARVLTEEQNRAAQDNAILEAAKTYTDNVKNALLGVGISETFDTLVEIQNWINGDGVNATELSAAVAEETQLRLNNDNALDQKIGVVNETLQAEINSREIIIAALNERINNLPVYTLTSGTANGTVAFNGTNVEVTGLGTAAYQNEEYFVPKVVYDLEIQTRDAQINGLNFEAKRLTNEIISLTELVNNLQERIITLENQNNQTE